MFELRATPKPTFQRRQPKRKNRSEFSPKTRQIILERDNYQCVRCGARAVHIHHIRFRSQGGTNDISNGASVCYRCHSDAHMKREIREWFERYQEEHLKEE